MPRKSKNNPNARNKNEVMDDRTCKICGKTGEMGVKVIRVLRGNDFMWLCKEMNGCR